MKNGHDHPHHDRSWSPRASLTNWRESDLPFGSKLRQALGNFWIKVSKRQHCCGHPGEPGC